MPNHCVRAPELLNIRLSSECVPDCLRFAPVFPLIKLEGFSLCIDFLRYSRFPGGKSLAKLSIYTSLSPLIPYMVYVNLLYAGVIFFTTYNIIPADRKS